MRKGQFFWLLAALVLILDTAPVGWSQSKAKRPDAPPAKQASPSDEEKPNAAGLPAPAGLRAGTKISATLESTVDTRTAKPGDAVVARVTKNVKQDGNIVVHKGDHLLGHVQSVEANSAADAGSRLAVSFDQLASGQTTTELHTVISSIFSTPREQEQGPMAEPMAPTMAPPAQGRSSAGSGGGLVGSVGSTVSSTVGAVGSAAGNVGQAVGSTVDATANTAAGAHAGTALATPARAIHVDSQANAENQTSASSILSTRHGQLRLESGTEMQFRVAGQAERQPPKQ